MGLSSLLRRHASDHVCAILESFPDMESTLCSMCEQRRRTFRLYTNSLSSQALTQNSSVLADEEVLDRGFVVLSGRRL